MSCKRAFFSYIDKRRSDGRDFAEKFADDEGSANVGQTD